MVDIVKSPYVVNRTNMRRTNMRDRDITFIKNPYWTQKAYIKLENTVSNDIKIKRGVRQGCVFSPSLFNLYTEHIFRSLEDLEAPGGR